MTGQADSRRGRAGSGGPRRRRFSDPFRFDRSLLEEVRLSGGGDRSGGLLVAGADEAGRGCLAGPIVAAAVVFDYGRPPRAELKGLTDSKLLSRAMRESMYHSIMCSAPRVTWVACSAPTIDAQGLHCCNLSALSRALELLHGDYRFAIVDAFDLHRADLRARGIVGADFKSAVVAAASVVAKVVRDRLMRNMDPRHPGYGFAEHVGYATGQHREALLEKGPCALHRRSFQGVSDQQLRLLEG